MFHLVSDNSIEEDVYRNRTDYSLKFGPSLIALENNLMIGFKS